MAWRVARGRHSFPFFYWYQLLWVPVVVVLTTICYLITTRVASPAPDGSGGPAPAPRHLFLPPQSLAGSCSRKLPAGNIVA